MHDGGLGVAEIGGQRQDPGGVDDLPRLFATAADPERQHAAECPLLAPGEAVARVVGQSGIEHALDRRVLGEPFRERLRRG